jgi:phosphoglucosamine mutase
MFASAFQAGICSSGFDIFDAGTLSSPAVSFLADHLDVCGAAMISASHNPAEHNGVKLFDDRGQKLSEASELEIEQFTASTDEPARAEPHAVGTVHQLSSPLDTYLGSLAGSIDGITFDGLSVVIDCANGAASGYAPELLRQLGARVIARNHDPNGANINDQCGATHPEALRGSVLENGADLGICLDGDADRVILLDDCGRVLDGDHVKFVWANHQHAKGRLRNRTVIGTLMSNLGLEHSLREIGCELVRTLVGDRHVYERMLEMQAVIGGEQSGHIIFGELARTGDGLLTALQIMAVMKETDSSLSGLAAPMKKFPQVLKNVPFDLNADWRTETMRSAIQEWEERLGDTGRILVRKSGTEPVLRVMCECTDADLAQEAVSSLEQVVTEEQLAAVAVASHC